MKIHLAFKYALIPIVFFSSVQFADAQTRDTTMYFFKAIGLGKRPVQTADSADYIEIIPPFRSTDPYVEIFEYYKNGTPKFTGKAITSTIRLASGYADYDGPCVSFYPSGKRQVITTYKDGIRAGLQYFYYPSGKLRMVVDNLNKQSYSINGSNIVDFYDKDGVSLCKDGNGIAISYDTDFNELERGTIKKGKKDGEWHGVIRDVDAGKYTLFYKQNIFQSGLGYETATGKSYPFKRIYVPATPNISPVYFIMKLRDHIKLPQGTSVTKKMIDSTRIFFIVEDDGRLTHFETIEPVPDELLQALKIAFSQSTNWEPAKLYGIPAQTQVALSLSIQPGGRFNSYDKEVENYQMVLYKGIPLGALPVLPKTY